MEVMKLVEEGEEVEEDGIAVVEIGVVDAVEEASKAGEEEAITVNSYTKQTQPTNRTTHCITCMTHSPIHLKDWNAFRDQIHTRKYGGCATPGVCYKACIIFTLGKPCRGGPKSIARSTPMQHAIVIRSQIAHPSSGLDWPGGGTGVARTSHLGGRGR